MVVLILILLSLGVAGFIMLSDTRKNDNFKTLEQAGGDVPAVDAASGDDGGGDGGGD
jgi:hypothetical protein